MTLQIGSYSRTKTSSAGRSTWSSRSGRTFVPSPPPLNTCLTLTEFLVFIFLQERPPEKKKKPRISMPNYGGPGSFIPSDSENSFGTLDSRTSLPESLRTNSSLGRLDLYTPAYGVTVRAQGSGSGSMERLADEFGGLNVGSGHGHARRRESYPVSLLIHVL